MAKLIILTDMAKRFFWFLVAVIALMVTVGLAGCSRKTTMPPVVVTQTSLQSDSLVRSLFSLIASERGEVRTDSFVRTERYFERTTVNERGDTLRHDTRSEISTEQYRALERECRMLRLRVDSLERVKCRIDSVPVPYEVEVPVPVERELSAWERARLNSWWWLAVALVGVAGYAWRNPLKRLVRKVIGKE